MKSVDKKEKTKCITLESTSEIIHITLQDTNNKTVFGMTFRINGRNKGFLGKTPSAFHNAHVEKGSEERPRPNTSLKVKRRNGKQMNRHHGLPHKSVTTVLSF